MDIEKDVEKIIKLSFPYVENWDDVIYDYSWAFEKTFIKLLKTLIVREKDVMLCSLISIDYFRRYLFFDMNYDFNDTLNNLKKITINLINIINET